MGSEEFTTVATNIFATDYTDLHRLAADTAFCLGHELHQ
jgi:hypothetical protein